MCRIFVIYRVGNSGGNSKLSDRNRPLACTLLRNKNVLNVPCPMLSYSICIFWCVPYRGCTFSNITLFDLYLFGVYLIQSSPNLICTLSGTYLMRKLACKNLATVVDRICPVAGLGTPFHNLSG